MKDEFQNNKKPAHDRSFKNLSRTGKYQKNLDPLWIHRLLYSPRCHLDSWSDSMRFARYLHISGN